MPDLPNDILKIINFEAASAYRRVSISGIALVSEEDFQQEAYLIALQAIPKFDPERGALTTFVANCVRNHLGKLAKRANKRDSYGILVDSVDESTIIDRTDLSEVEKSVLYHTTNQGMSAKEVASWMDISEETVLRHLRSICEKLKS